VRGTGSLRFAQNWTVLGSGTYDIERSVVTNRGIGFGYDDECFTFNVSYAESVNRDDEDDVKKTIGFNLSFRTIGDFGSSQSLAHDTN
jgi:LPS-assembly protein